MRPDLHLDFCSYEAAKHAVMRWHYSRRMPKSKLVRIGVWEEGRFVGGIVHGVGANRHLASHFDLQDTEVCELVRVALAPGRQHPASQCVAISLKLLRRQSPGLRLSCPSPAGPCSLVSQGVFSKDLLARYQGMPAVCSVFARDKFCGRANLTQSAVNVWIQCT